MKKSEIQNITSCSNALVKSMTALRQTGNRVREEAFIFEGSKLFEEAMHWHVSVSHVLFTERWLARTTKERRLLLDLFEGEKYVVSDAVMHKLTGQKQPEGIFCRAKIVKQSQDFLKQGKAVVVLENVQDPGNVGTIIRTADAAGFSAVLTTVGTADCYNEKVLRASMGSVFHLPVVQHLELGSIFQDLKALGFTVIGSALEGSEELFQSPPVNILPALVLGNESSGMTAAARKACDCLMRIPMSGHAESLNVSVAAGLMLYRFL